MKIIVLGSGCVKCNMVEQRTKSVVVELGIDAEIAKEGDINKIISYGILHTPGLVVDGEVVVSGRIPSMNELRAILSQKIIK